MLHLSSSELAQMESKDVQQLFTDVLGSQGNHPLPESTLSSVKTVSESHLLTSHGLGELIRPSLSQQSLLSGKENMYFLTLLGLS